MKNKKKMKTSAYITSIHKNELIQKSSYCWFILRGLKDLFLNYKIFLNNNQKDEFEFVFDTKNILFRKPLESAINSKDKKLDYNIGLYIPISIYSNYKFISKINIFFCNIPLITNRGTFLINGCERVVINQIIRNSGIYSSKLLDDDQNTMLESVFASNTGAWLRFYLDLGTYKIYYLSELIQNDFIFLKNIYSYNFYFYFFDVFKKVLLLDLLNFDLGDVGRIQVNFKFNKKIPLKFTSLFYSDILLLLKYLFRLNFGSFHYDDVDNLENKRIRSIGDIFSRLFEMGFDQFNNIFRENVYLSKQVIVSYFKIFMKFLFDSLFYEFFTSSNLSQYAEQINPLSELIHIRRVSSLGFEGFDRDSVTIPMRDIHYSNHGRICPLETAEGQNAGLVMAFASYSRLNSFGFIETPYYIVKDKVIFKKYSVVFLTVSEEKYYYIAFSDTYINNLNEILLDKIFSKHFNNIEYISSDSINLITVSPVQNFSLGIVLVPFFEHNDAIRSLMGSNMQRQTVPLFYSTKPIVGTGFEMQIARETEYVILNKNYGFVFSLSNNCIIIINSNGSKVLYKIDKFLRTNYSTCLNYNIVVWLTEFLQPSQIIANSSAIDQGELSLGQNIFVAYMPWEGYNFEDAVLISDRLLYNDLFTSVHIKKYESSLYKLEAGLEIFTNKFNDKIIKSLDSTGLIKKGFFVYPSDIIIGKLSPVYASDLFEDNFIEFQLNNTSLDITLEKLFSKITNKDISKIKDKNNYSNYENLIDSFFNFEYYNTSTYLPIGSYGRVISTRLVNNLNLHKEEGFATAYVFIAQIRKLQIGDKIAGRHGNKGIVSKILSNADMPFIDKFGLSIDIILNPLGVPSRMNVGQLFEGLLGFAGSLLKKRFKIIPFDEVFGKNSSRILINYYFRLLSCLRQNNIFYNKSTIGKFTLIDGRTGMKFDNLITVCKSYIIKLVHLVEDKIHARMEGPYSVITQQPLGGRSHRGGQRLGEMEIWAFESFGAAYNLQEILTLKSDDLISRNNFLKSIIINSYLPKVAVPDSFKVLITELKSLGLNFSFFKLDIFSNVSKLFEIHDIKFFKLPNYSFVELLE